MRRFEYKVIPAPEKGRKSKGVRGTQNRFANALQEIMNEQGNDGWQYLRTDTLPCEERQGLTRRNTVFQNLLVFCKETGGDDDLSRSQKAIDDHPDTVMPEPTELWAETETVAEAEVVEIVEDIDLPERSNGETQRLGGVTRAEKSAD